MSYFKIISRKLLKQCGGSRMYSVKRKKPLDPLEAEILPIFQYPVAKSSDRRVYVWGLSETGALGLQLPAMSKRAEQKNSMKITEYPTRLQFAEKFDVTNISCGYGFSVFAVKSSDCFKVFGTGLNTDSQIGYHAPRRSNPLEILLYPAPIKLPLNFPETTKIAALSSGRAHLIIVTDAEGVFTIGNNSYGQCGRRIIPKENYKSSMIMHHITDVGGEAIIDAQCGQDHSMFLTKSGKVYACGWGSDGQLGRGDYETDYNIDLVKGDITSEKIIKVSCSADCILALNDYGDVFGWGNTEYGQLLYPDKNDQQVNVSRIIIKNNKYGKITDIAAGGSTCLILNESGEVFVWGYGILGKGPEVQVSSEPSRIPTTLFGKNEFNPSSKVIKIYSGLSHMAAITNQGDLYTWGKNKYGCLGLGHSKDQYFPLKSSIGCEVLKVSLGIDHTIALCKPFV